MNGAEQATALGLTSNQDSFSPMGLNQEQLKAKIFANVMPRRNWVDDIKASLRVRGQAQFNTRFIWKGLPSNIDSQQLERMLYYRGMLGMFWHEDYGFIILPVTQQARPVEQKEPTVYETSSINFMGRWKFARAVPFNGGGEDDKTDGGEKQKEKEKRKEENRRLKLVLAEMGIKDVLWEVPVVDNQDDAVRMMKNCCVILYDYTPQISEIPQARQILENPFYDGQVELLKMIRTASFNSTGVQWVRVNNQAEADLMRDQFRVYDQMILNGVRYICISATTEIQESSTKSTAQMQEFWTSWQSLENLRQSCIGLGNDGMLQKSQYTNQMEMALDNIGNNPVLVDAWLQRVKFCTIANALWGTNIGVEVAGMSPMDATPEQSSTESADNGSAGGAE